MHSELVFGLICIHQIQGGNKICINMVGGGVKKKNVQWVLMTHLAQTLRNAETTKHLLLVKWPPSFPDFPTQGGSKSSLSTLA